MQPYGFSNESKKIAYFKEEKDGVVYVVVKDGQEEPTDKDIAVPWLSLLNGYATWLKLKPKENVNPNPDSPTPDPDPAD
ncbi:MAG: hypothetical protein AAGA46_03090 [Cyanobacteria bacterium P01_F01_bin.13]